MTVRRRPVPKVARPAGSWELSIARAREAWDHLTGGPTVLVEGGTGERVYSETAAAAILATALGLWADSALAVADGPGPS